MIRKKINLPANRGLIALIEMNILYSGNVLLTVRHGSYQETIIDLFITIHQERYISEEGISNTSSALEKAKELYYGPVCDPGKENIHELSDIIGPNC